MKNKKGMTLIELIVSIALIGIIVVGFLPAFTVGFAMIAKAGSTSKAQYNTQAQTEKDLSSGPSVTSDTLDIKFSDNSTIQSSGQIKSQSSTVNGRQVNVTFFIPQN